MGFSEIGYSHGGARACCAKVTAQGGEGFGGPLAKPHYPPNLEIEPIHLAISATVTIEKRTADLAVQTTVRSNREGATDLELDGVNFADLEVRDLGGAGIRTSYDGKKIRVTWERPLARGEERILQCRYRVIDPVTGLFFMAPTPEEPLRPRYAATDHETERARYWLACVDLPSVRTTLEFRLTAAAELTVLANGALVDEEINGDGTKTTHWRLAQRCPSYLTCFAIGDFVRLDDGQHGEIPVAAFATRDFSTEDLRSSFGKTRAMLEWMTRKLDLPFPFPKYFQFALPNFGGAMENISLVSWDDSLLTTARSTGEGQFDVDQTNVHEMAHAYFGDLVVCRDFAHAWLKESWATYMETCWLEDSKGRDEQLYDLYRNGQSYFAEVADRYARPLVTRHFTSSWQMYDRHLYPGGACRLHTLRCELGDEIFWAGVRDYLRTYQQQVVETDDFRKVLERHSGRSLQRFFDQWVYSEHAPKLKVTFAYDDKAKLGTFTIEQQQASGDQAVQPFELTTDLGWTIAGADHEQVVRLTAARQAFQVAMAAEPDQVRFDPHGRILHRLEFDPGEAKLKIQLTSARDVIGRIQAAKALAATGKRDAIKAVAEAYAEEPFWGVRREMAAALADAKASAAAMAALAAILSTEADPNVLPAVIDRCLGLREPRLASAMAVRLAPGGALGPRTRARLIHGLAAQGLANLTAAQVDLIKAEAMGSERQYGSEQGAALRALATLVGGPDDIGQAALLKEGLLNLVLGAVRLGATHFRARAQCLLGLGAAVAGGVSRGVRQVIVAELMALLRDPDPRVARAAASALGTAEASEAAGALAAYRAPLPLQEQVFVDGILRSLSPRDGAGRVAALEKQVQDLQAKLRAVMDQVQDLEHKWQQRPDTRSGGTAASPS